MTEFFRSAQVRAALAELAEIQDDLAHTMSSPRILSDDEKKDYVRKLKLFLEKQKLFFFRVSLSDDPEAVQVKEHLSSNISIEEMIIYENIFSYVKEHDDKLIDPVLESVSLKIKKYIPFLNINMLEYRKHLIEQVQRKN